jgi:hypothetical protein
MMVIIITKLYKFNLYNSRNSKHIKKNVKWYYHHQDKVIIMHKEKKKYNIYYLLGCYGRWNAMNHSI